MKDSNCSDCCAESHPKRCRRAVFDVVSSYTLNHPLSQLCAHPGVSLTTRARNVDNPRTPACIRSALSVRHFIEHLEHGASGSRGRRSSLASRPEICRRFSACCTRSGLDRQGRGAPEAGHRRRHGKSYSAAGLLLDLEPMAWGTTAEFTCDAWGCGLTVGA